MVYRAIFKCYVVQLPSYIACYISARKKKKEERRDYKTFHPAFQNEDCDKVTWNQRDLGIFLILYFQTCEPYGGKPHISLNSVILMLKKPFAAFLM